MDDLAKRISAEIDEDERVAREADDDNTEFGTGPSSWTDPYSEFHGRSSNPEFAHVLRHGPARVLRRVAADREILRLHDRMHSCTYASATDDVCLTIRALAEAYGVDPAGQ